MFIAEHHILLFKYVKILCLIYATMDVELNIDVSVQGSVPFTDAATPGLPKNKHPPSGLNS